MESLNEMIDMQTTRVSALNNRVPHAILFVEVIGAAVALGLMALYLAALSRGVVTVLLAAGLITMLLYVTFDLDRPARGLIEIPDAALVGAPCLYGAAAGGRRAPLTENRAATKSPFRPSSSRRSSIRRGSSGAPAPSVTGAIDTITSSNSPASAN